MATKAVVKKTKIETIKCEGACGQVLLPDLFYNKGDGSGRCKICKACVSRMIQEKDGSINIGRFVDFLENAEIPYLAKIWNAVQGDSDMVGEYVRRLWSIADNENLLPCYLTDDDVAGIFDASHLQVTQELIRKWNTDDVEQIRFLESEYQDWVNSREINDKAIIEIILQICYTKLDIVEGRKNNDYKLVKEATSRLQELMGSANLKPVQDAINSTNETLAFGVFIKRCEDTDPVGVDDEPPWAIESRKWVIGQISKIENVQGAILDEYNEMLDKYSVDLGGEDDETAEKDETGG